MVEPVGIPARSDHRNGPGLAAPEHIRCPITGRRLHLRRAWPREAGHLLLEYLDGGRGAATVAGQWFADGSRLHEVAGETAGAAASADMVVALHDVGVLLQRGGADRRLEALAGVLRRPGATLMVHRPERRGVVRVVRPASTTYVKVVRPGRLHEPPDICDEVRTPSALSFDRATGIIEYAELHGASLHERLGDAALADQVVASAFRATGAMLRRLHAIPLPTGLPSHGAAAEQVVTARWLDLALAHRVLEPAAADSAREAMARAETLLLSAEPPATPSLIHRDLHDKQVLADTDGAVGVLDLDTMARGDPALDVANLLVHLELRCLQGLCGPDRAGAARVAFVEGYGTDRGLLARLSGYSAATRLRLACVYAFRPRWKGVAGRLLAGDASVTWPGGEARPSGFAGVPAVAGRLRS